MLLVDPPKCIVRLHSNGQGSKVTHASVPLLLATNCSRQQTFTMTFGFQLHFKDKPTACSTLNPTLQSSPHSVIHFVSAHHPCASLYYLSFLAFSCASHAHYTAIVPTTEDVQCGEMTAKRGRQVLCPGVKVKMANWKISAPRDRDNKTR